MSYEIESINVPDTATTGQPIEITADVCCTNSGGCELTRERMFINGTKVAESQTAPSSAFCIPLYAGTDPFDGTVASGGQGFNVDKTAFTVTFTDPGTYTISAETDTGASASATITVEEPQANPSLVETDCSAEAPTNPSPGDDVTLEATVNNGNPTAVDVALTFQFGTATQSTTVTVPANDSTTVTRAFTAEEAATYDPNIEDTVITESALTMANGRDRRSTAD